MTNIADTSLYAQFANAAYINLDDLQVLSGRNIAINANQQNIIPSTLGEYLFDPDAVSNIGKDVWKIPNGGYHGNDPSGFSATLFEKGNEKVLAVRGTAI